MFKLFFSYCLEAISAHKYQHKHLSNSVEENNQSSFTEKRNFKNLFGWILTNYFFIGGAGFLPLILSEV